MEIQHNSRQIPSNEKYTANKKYSDLLYGYLQQKSMLDESIGLRYLPKKDIKYVQMAEDLNLSRQTASRRFNSLIEQELVYYDEDNKRYILTKLESDLAALLPCDTVRILCASLQERSLSVLAYLLKTYFQHGQRPCEVNIDVIKKHIGLNTDNRGSNNQIVKDIFIVLKKLGLIEYHVEKAVDTNSGGFKTKYILDKVDNQIKLSE